MPVTDIDDVHHFVEYRVRKDAVLHIAGAAKGNDRMVSGLSFPLSDGLQPESCEMQWTCVFRTKEMHHIGLVFQLIKTHADILTMQRPEHWVLLIVELFCNEYALVAGKWYRLREVRSVDVVHRAPGAVYPMGTGFQYVMLEVMLIEKEYLFSGSLAREVLKTVPIPAVGLCKVIP